MMQINKEPPAVPAPMPACAPLLSDLDLDVEDESLDSPLPLLLSPSPPPLLPPPPPPPPSVTVTTFTTETPGVKVKVVVKVVELFALMTEVTVCHIVVEYVAVARAATVVVTKRVDVEDIVIVLTTYVDVTTFCRLATC